MKSITVHNLETFVYDKMKAKADELGISMGKYIRTLIKNDLNVNVQKQRYDLSFLEGRYKDLDLDNLEKDLELFDSVSMENFDEKD